MRKILLTAFIIMMTLFPLSAADIAISGGTFTFGSSVPSVDEAMYADIGITAGLTERVEGELSLVSEITPVFAGNLLVKSSVSYALLSPLYRQGDFVPMYVNSFIGIGIMGKVPSFDMWGPFITITPLTSGGPQFLRKEKVASCSLYYDIPSASFGFFFQLFALDVYVTGRT